jgi:hypothetical protein
MNTADGELEERQKQKKKTKHATNGATPPISGAPQVEVGK